MNILAVSNHRSQYFNNMYFRKLYGINFFVQQTQKMTITSIIKIQTSVVYMKYTEFDKLTNTET
jgi:hypothetical protein